MNAILISIKFDQNWILSTAKSGRSTVVDDVVTLICKQYGAQAVITVEKSLHFLKLVIGIRDKSGEEVEAFVRESVVAPLNTTGEISHKALEKNEISEMLSSLKLDEKQKEFFENCFELDFERDNFIKQIDEIIGKPPQKPKDIDLTNFIGFEPLKKWVIETLNVAEKFGNIMAQTAVMSNVVYLMSINRGNGFSTILDIMAQTLEKTKLLKFSGSRKVVEIRLDYNEDPERFNSFAHLVELVENKYNGIVALDIEEWIDHLNDSRIDALLNFIWSTREKLIYVFKIPYAEDSVIAKVYDRIDDVISVRMMKFVPLSDVQYFEFFKTFFSSFGMEVEENAYRFFKKKLADERNDGKFYGFNTVRKFANEILYSIIADSAKNDKAIPDRVMGAMFEKLYDFEDDDSLSGMEQLDSMIALEAVKEKVKEILSSAKFQRDLFSQGVSSERPCYHMMFTGNPGTGKTVVARIIGRIFKEEGLLPVGNFFEVSRKDFIGKFVGHTAPKTMEICRSAYGSVLFIDEAYLLADKRDGYSSEAIGTLIAEMENNRDKMVVIFAGYEKELEELLDMNSGLRDRIPHKIDFPNYSRDELKQIFYLKLNKAIKRNDSFDKEVDKFFAEFPQAVLSDRSFSNGRFVRNLAERIMSKAALRVEMAGIDISKFELTEGDFTVAIADKDFQTLMNRRKHSKSMIGF